MKCHSTMEQKLFLQEDVPAFSSGSDGREKWLQHLHAHVHSGVKLKGSLTKKLNLGGLCTEPNPTFQNFPCSQLSEGPKQRHPQEKNANFIDSGKQNEGNMQKHPSETLQNTHATRKKKIKADSNDSEDYMSDSHVHKKKWGTRKRKSKADSNDSEDYMPHSHVHRKQRGTRKSKGTADSSDSETYVPRPRVRGQRRNLLHFSNSITQGMLDSKTFELYFENIWSGISEEKRKSFAYLDSLWFNLYTKSYYKEKVLNWIKRKDIFSKKYVLVPIVMWSHWSLLILCHFGEESKSRRPCMVLLDSLQAANQSLEPQIQKFVSDIHKVEGRPANRELIRKIPLLVPKVPQQKNGEECGCYVLFYINLFLETAPERFSISDGYPYFMKEDWFTVESLDNFRHRLSSVPVLSSSSEE